MLGGCYLTSKEFRVTERDLGNKYDVFKHEAELKKYGIKLPKAIEFSNLVYKKTGKKIGYRDDINDILKDVYRNAR